MTDQTAQIDPALLSREIDAEITMLKRTGYDVPAICARDIEITKNCRERIANREPLLADYDLNAFVASVEATPDRAYEMLNSLVPHSRWEEAEATLIARGLVPDPDQDAFYEAAMRELEAMTESRDAAAAERDDAEARATRLQHKVWRLRVTLAAVAILAAGLLFG